MMEWIQSLLPHLQNLGIAGYWLLMLVTFGESLVFTGMFVPGTVLLVIMGGLVPQDYYDFGDLMFFAVCGSILGDAISYEVGRLGRFHIERYSFIRGYLKRGRDFFDQHGGKSVLMGRFIGPIRPIIPFIAGVSVMKRVPFYLYNVVSAIGWSLCYLLLGVFFGYAWKAALAWSSAAVGAVVVVVLIIFFVRWFRQTKRATTLGDI